MLFIQKDLQIFFLEVTRFYWKHIVVEGNYDKIKKVAIALLQLFLNNFYENFYKRL